MFLNRVPAMNFYEADDEDEVPVNDEQADFAEQLAHGIKLLNIDGTPQTVRDRATDSDSYTIIGPRGSWNPQFDFASNSEQELFNNVLRLKNPTGHREDLAVELTAVPKTPLCLPRTINFGNVDIGKSVTRKLSLTPESDPYQFRIFIPRRLEGLSVNPTCGEVLCNTPTNVTVSYTPQFYITLNVNLIFYSSKANQEPKIITLMAVTKPKTTSPKTTNTEKSVPKKMISPPFRRKIIKDKTKKDDKPAAPVDYSWNSALGEPDKTYRDVYLKQREEFFMKVKLFGMENKMDPFKVHRSEPKIDEEQLKRDIIDKRNAEWSAYEEKLCSYKKILRDNPTVPLGFRERSIRMNHINDSKHDFDKVVLGNDWWVRFRTYKRFIKAVHIVIIRNRLQKRLNLLKTFVRNNRIKKSF